MNRSREAYRIAFCGVMAALGTAVMLLGGLVPVFTYCSPILAGILLVAVKDELDARGAWMTWAVTGMLSLLIGADKEASLFYVFLGWYPILKPGFDAISRKPLRVAVKVAVFALSVGAMYFLSCRILGIDEIVSSFSTVRWVNALFFAGIIICMLLYDRALNAFFIIYRVKLRPKLNFMNRK